MPHPAQHHHRPFLLNTTSSRPRRLAAGLCLAASLALSACGPAHKGQLTVEPANASAEASTSGSKPSETPSPTPSKTPSASATWSRPSVSFTNEDSSVWFRNDDLADTSKNSEDAHIEGFEFNGSRACQGYISQRVSEEYFTPYPTDDLDSKSVVMAKTDDFSTYQTTSTPSVVEAVRDDNGTMPGYEVSFSGNVNFTDAPNTPVEGYRFSRVAAKEGYVFFVFVFCHKGASASLDEWHKILAGIRIRGIDAGAM